MVTRLLAFLSTLCLALPSTAQTSSPPPPLTGTHVLLKRDGSPPIVGATTTTVIVPTAWPGVYASVNYVDHGTGPVPLEGEQKVIWGSGSLYYWQNDRGTQGRLTWPGGDEWLSEVLTGPNAGTVRRMVRQN